MRQFGIITFSIDVFQAGLFQALAHFVVIQAQHAGGEDCALGAFVGFARLRGVGHLLAIAAGTTTTPSISATTTSPGLTCAPAHTTGIFTDPNVALMVPLALIARLNTGSPFRSGL